MIYSYIYADAINEIRKMTYLDTSIYSCSDEALLNRHIKIDLYYGDNFLNFQNYGDNSKSFKMKNQEALKIFEADNKIKRLEIKMNKLRDGYLYMNEFSWGHRHLYLSKHKLNIKKIKRDGLTVNEIYEEFTLHRDKMLKNEVIDKYTKPIKDNYKGKSCCNSICGQCD
jgi:hypothetical protein